MGRGGSRPGSGRKRGSRNLRTGGGEKTHLVITDVDAPDFLRMVWNDAAVEMALRIKAAEVMIRVGEVKKGKKETAVEKARAAGSGKFSPSKPPFKLVK